VASQCPGEKKEVISSIRAVAGVPGSAKPMFGGVRRGGSQLRALAARAAAGARAAAAHQRAARTTTTIYSAAIIFLPYIKMGLIRCNFRPVAPLAPAGRRCCVVAPPLVVGGGARGGGRRQAWRHQQRRRRSEEESGRAAARQQQQQRGGELNFSARLARHLLLDDERGCGD
jgi:hypothetical protein